MHIYYMKMIRSNLIFQKDKGISLIDWINNTLLEMSKSYDD